MAEENSAVPADFYPLGEKVVGDEFFACKTEKLALKIQKIGLAPENAGAIIENQPCFFLNRFDHIPRRHGNVMKDLMVMEVEHERMGLMVCYCPIAQNPSGAANAV